MEFLRTLRAPAAVAGSYLATMKLTKAVVGNLPYEANPFWKALAHVLPVRNPDILPNPTPWVYSREYLGCLGRNTKLCLLPTSSTPEQLAIVTEDMLPKLPETVTTFSLWQAAKTLATKLPEVLDTEWATYAILDTVAQDLASGSRGRLSPLTSSVWTEMEGDLEAFLEGEDAYFDAIEETAAPVAAAFSTTANDEDDWENNTFEEEVQDQIRDISMMLQRITIKHRQELDHVMRVSSDQAKKLVRSNRKLRQSAVDAQEKVTELENAQKTLTTKSEGIEDQVRQLKDQAEQNAKGAESLKATGANLLAELGEAEEKNERLVNENESLRKDLTTTQGELAGSNAKIAGLESQAKALNESVDEARSARDNSIEIKLALENEYEFLNDCCDDAEKAKDEAEEKLIEAQKVHEEAYSFLQADHSKLTNDYKILENSYECAAKSADDAVKDLVEAKDTVQDLEAEVERLKADKASEDARRDTLNDISNELSEAKKTISKLRDEIKITEADHAESEQILENRIDEVQAEMIRADVSAHDKALALEEELNELKEVVITWQETSEAHATEFEALKNAKNAALEELTAENDKLKDQVKELQANYNGARYNTLDKERRSLQGKLADQKQATLVARGDVRRLEREVAALQKLLQAQGVPTPENDGEKDKQDRDGDGGKDGHGRPDGGLGKKSVDNHNGSPEASAGKLPAGSNNHEAAGNNDSNPSPPTDSRPSGSTFNGPTTRGGTADRSPLPRDPSATTTVPESDPFADDFVPSGSQPRIPCTPADTPFNGVSSIPGNVPMTSKSLNPKGSTAEAVPSQKVDPSTSTPASTKISPLSGSATTFVPKSVDNTATSSSQSDTNFENYINKHIGKASDTEDSAGPVSEEELGKREKELAEKIARGDAKAQAAHKARRAAVEARFTKYNFFPGAKEKTDDEMVSEAMVDELEKLPSKSLEQSMWAVKGPQKAQQPTGSQGQCQPPKQPAPQPRPTPYGHNTGVQGPPRNDWRAIGTVGGPVGIGYGQQPQGQLARGNFNVQGGQRAHGNHNSGHGARGAIQQNQAPPEAPKKPAAMLKKNKDKKGGPCLPPHLRGTGPGAPPSGGSQTSFPGQGPYQ